MPASALLPPHQTVVDVLADQRPTGPAQPGQMLDGFADPQTAFRLEQRCV